MQPDATGQLSRVRTSQTAVVDAPGAWFGAFYFYYYFSWRREAGGNALPGAGID